MLQEEKPLKVLLVNSSDSNIELTFTTPAPYAQEQDNSTNDKFDKKVTVAHESALHYTNVTAFSPIPEDLVSQEVDFRLFWNINNTRVDVTDDPRFAVEFVDTDLNGAADQMQWVVPQLSEQEFDIEADLEIINVQSYPSVGETWKVKFVTNGTADLRITAVNGTTFGDVSPDDLKFLELNNGTHKLNPIVNGNTITYYNYSSTGEGFEESEVLTAFYHHLMFEFGNKTAFAHNSAFVPNGPQTILLYGDPVPLGTLTAEDDMALTSPIIMGWDEMAERQDSIYVHDHTGGGCNSPTDSCTEVQVTEAGTYRVNYGLTVKVGSIDDARWQATSFVQNRTDSGSYNGDDGISCFDGSYKRTQDAIVTTGFSGECILDLEADDWVRVGWSRADDNAGSSGLSLADDENWFSITKVENPVIALRANNESVQITTGPTAGDPMEFVDADIITYDTSLFTFDGSSANSDVTVDEDGLYKVTYSAHYFDDSSRTAVRGDILVNTGSGFANTEYGASVGYVRGVATADAADHTGYSSSTILDLNANDVIRFVSVDVSTDNGFVQDYHLDIEYIGTSTSANVLRLHNSTGGIDMEQTDLTIKWDIEDLEGSHFTFTHTSEEITVNINGLYHIGYGIESDNQAGNGNKFGQKTKVQINTGSGYVDAKACYGVGFSRGGNSFDDHIATSSCMLELEIGDKLRVVSSQVSDPATTVSVADRSWLTIQSLTISNPPLEESLVLNDVLRATLVKNAGESLSLVDVLETDKDAVVLLTESLSLSDPPVTVTSAGVINVAFEEPLSLDDGTIVNVVQPLKPQESLTIVDEISIIHDKTFSLIESLSLNDGLVENESFVAANPDYKIQYGTFTIASASATGTITSSGGSPDFDVCTGDCFIMQVSTRQTGMGTTSGGGVQNVNDVTTYVSNEGGLTTPGTITFTRDGTTNDNRIAWQIIEYIGPAGGPNEMKVLDTGIATFASNSTTNGNDIPGGAGDDNDVAVIITGISGDAANTDDYDSVLITSEWVGASNEPKFTRDATGAANVDVSYAVVEFSGSAWNLQRVEHEGVDSPSPIQTETISDVGDISRAFILQAQQRNADGAVADGPCETGEVVWLSDTDELSFLHETGGQSCVFDEDMNEVIWVLSNSLTETGKRMIVEHQQPPQRGTGGGNEDNFQRTINTLTYGTDETGIFGFTANADDTVTTEHPHGTVVARLTGSTSVDFWHSDDGEELNYAFSVVQWPRSRTLTVEFNESLSLSDDSSFNLRISLNESLTLNDGVVEAQKIASVSLNESLSLEDIINKNIPVSFDESLSLVDDINKNIPVILTENLVLDDGLVETAANITVSLTEDLELVDVINRNVPVSLTETLDLEDVINRNVPVSFTEDLELVDVINRNVPVSLSETLSLVDVINRNVPVSLTETLDLEDVINRNIPVSLSETLDLEDVINRDVSVSFTEDLELVDVINRNVPVSFTEDLELVDVINRNVPVSFTEDLELVDVINRNIPISLTETLSLAEFVTRDATISLTESLPLDDGAVEVISSFVIDFTESLTFNDETAFEGALQIETLDNQLLVGGATFLITPDPSDGIGSMTVVDNGVNDINGTSGAIRVASVPFDSYVITIPQAGIPSGYIVTVNHTSAAVSVDNASPDLSFTLVGDNEDLSIIEPTVMTSAPIMNSTQLDNMQGLSAIIIDNQTQIIVTDTEQLPALISVGVNNTSGITNATNLQSNISWQNTLPAGSNGDTVQDTLDLPTYRLPTNTTMTTIVPLAVSTETSSHQIMSTPPVVEFLSGHQIIMPVEDSLIASFGGMIKADITTKDNATSTGIFIGDWLVFENANQHVGTPTLASSGITNELELQINVMYRYENDTVGINFGDEDNIESAALSILVPIPSDPEIITLANGCADVEGHTLVGGTWTGGIDTITSNVPSTEHPGFCEITLESKHYSTKSISSKRSTSPGAGPGDGGAGTGGSRGGGGGGGGAVPGYTGILGTPLTINEVSYDRCDENMARILVSSDAEAPPTVVLHTSKSGTVYAKLASIQPFADSNQLTKIDKYVYEAPIASDETFMMIIVTEIRNGIENRVQSPIYLDSCRDTTVIAETPGEDEISLDVPRIFDVKFQIANQTKQKPSIDRVFYLDNQDLTVSAIIDSKSPLKRVELRTVPMGESIEQYVAVRMDIKPLEVSETSYLVTATLPSYFVVQPGIKYWIHVLDEEINTVDSRQYEIGAKPTRFSNVSVEMDVPTIKPAGASIKPEVYINTENAAAYGIVSLVADGEIVSQRTHLFEIGQTRVTFDWDIPKSNEFANNELQGRVDLYDSSVITNSAMVHSFPRTVSVSASELGSLELIELDGQVLAEPALIYASNTDDNLQFRVTDPQGQCVIGGTGDCAISESTRDNRGGLTSIMYADQVLRVRYSGADNALERFSITSIDPIINQWTVSLEKEDGGFQEAHASQEPVVKVKYRYHSETVTVFSN